MRKKRCNMLNMKTLLCSTAAIFIVSCANAEDYVYREAQPRTSQSVTYSNPTYYNEPSILNNIFGHHSSCTFCKK